MLIVIVFCMMCVASVLGREERIAQTGDERQEQDEMVAAYGML